MQCLKRQRSANERLQNQFHQTTFNQYRYLDLLEGQGQTLFYKETVNVLVFNRAPVAYILTNIIFSYVKQKL